MNKRQQIRGDGPRRNKLQSFVKIGQVSDKTLHELNHVLESTTQNDISTDNYGISSTIDYEKTHGAYAEFYRQVIIQGKQLDDTDEEDRNEFRYSNWLTEQYDIDHTLFDMSNHFSDVCRFRLSEMKPHCEMNWHIDTDTSVACRAQICLNDNDSTFEIKDRDGVHQVTMKPGEMWFFNTGWNHRVVTGDDLRRVAVWTFKFDMFRNPEKLYI